MNYKSMVIAALAMTSISGAAMAADLSVAPEVVPFCREWKLLPFEQRNCNIGSQSGGGSVTVRAVSRPTPPSPPSDPGCGDGDGRDHGNHGGHGNEHGSGSGHDRGHDGHGNNHGSHGGEGHGDGKGGKGQR